MRAYSPVEVKGLPRFFGGAVGYISYDMVRFFEKLPASTEDDLGWYDAYLMITDSLLIFDNLKHTLKVMYNIHLDGSVNAQTAYTRATAKINRMIAYLNKPLKKERVNGHVACLMLSQVSLTSQREHAADASRRLTAAGGNKGAQEANVVFSVDYTLQIQGS